MNRDELIYKWLNHELNADELEAFKQLEDYRQLVLLNEGVQTYKAPNYNVSEELNSVLEQIERKKSRKKSWFPMAASIAAVVLVLIGYFYYSTTQETEFKTLASQKLSIELPDGSFAQLNAQSDLSFNKNQWQKNREIKLNGEAYFDVSKGSKFEVETPDGTVTVLGTKFNIKQRKEFFEVVCYEGLVNVKYSTFDINLNEGDSFVIRDGKLIATEKENNPTPSWIDNYSQFSSVPYKEVLAEFERQYDVNIELSGIDTKQLFTGSFSHGNIEVALKSITLPLKLTYSKTNRTITLKRE